MMAKAFRIKHCTWNVILEAEMLPYHGFKAETDGGFSAPEKGIEYYSIHRF
jgi:hypothetical protein